MIVIFIFQTYKSIKNKSYIKSKKNKVKFNMFFFFYTRLFITEKKIFTKMFKQLTKIK